MRYMSDRVLYKIYFYDFNLYIANNGQKVI